MNTATKVAAGRKSRAKKAPAVTPEDRALAERLLATPTIPDRTWASGRGASRIEGETRSEFICRVLLGES